MVEMDKKYNPQSIEDKIYAFWENGKYFHPEVDENKEPFTIVIPPPNVTGQLHAGHALNNTLQDIFTRFNRMKGKAALWLPGYDHAGISTQIRVEKEMREKEGITRHDLGREAFLQRVWDWKNKYGNRIVEQLKRMGCSCDWDRQSFTMDENFSNAVRKVFVDYYNEGLIYRGNRIINWCPSCATALSDSEVEHEPQQGNLWHIKYPIKDSDEFIIIATTRPETMLGDTAIAVNPKDKRYTHLVGKTAILPLVNREIPIVADDYVDSSFGTGCVKITPSHDPNDFEVGQRHNLESIIMLNEDATVNENGGKYAGLDRYAARKAIVSDLKEVGLLDKIETHEHNVGTCYRCDTVIEPLSSRQWFVKMAPLAKPALDVVNDGQIKFIPERYTKIYRHWMENIRDWCISRQLWWGHRIPAFYCDACEQTFVSMTDLTTCSKCGGALRQDEDVLDTWFSSALWPMGTLDWPEIGKDFEYFYPTNLLITAYEIISLWVARMIFSGMHFTGKIPFDTVMITGLVRDSEGRKMSKSLDNGVDPIEVIEQYGADALRFMLVSSGTPGHDMRFYMERVEAARNFANKIWNASRFVQMNISDAATDQLPERLTLADKWILTKLNRLIGDVTSNLEKYEYGISATKLYDFIWDDFCDWYIELAKPRLNAGDIDVQCMLVHVLSRMLKVLHPFMPYISEEIYGYLPIKDRKPLIIADWETPCDAQMFESEVTQMEMLQEAIRAIRNIRSEMNVPPSMRAKIMIVTPHDALFEENKQFFEKMAWASEVVVAKEKAELGEGALDATVSVVTAAAELFMPQGDLVDKEKEIARLTAERERLLKELQRVSDKLANGSFVDKAPAAVVDGERKKQQQYSDMLQKVETGLEALK